MSATPLTVLHWSFWIYAGVFLMVWGCACGLDIIVRLFFVTFSTLWTLSFSDLKFYESIDCKLNSLYNFIPIFMQLCTSFFHGLKICMWFWFNPQLKFVSFPHCWLCHFSIFRRCDIKFTEVQSIFCCSSHGTALIIHEVLTGMLNLNHFLLEIPYTTG